MSKKIIRYRYVAFSLYTGLVYFIYPNDYIIGEYADILAFSFFLFLPEFIIFFYKKLKNVITNSLFESGVTRFYQMIILLSIILTKFVIILEWIETSIFVRFLLSLVGFTLGVIPTLTSMLQIKNFLIYICSSGIITSLGLAIRSATKMSEDQNQLPKATNQLQEYNWIDGIMGPLGGFVTWVALGLGFGYVTYKLIIWNIKDRNDQIKELKDIISKKETEINTLRTKLEIKKDK